MGAVRRRVLVLSLVLVAGLTTLAFARSFAEDASEGRRGTGGGPPDIRGALPGGPGGGPPAGIPADPKGPPIDPPGCRNANDEDAIADAFQNALDRWLRSAKGIYGRQYAMVGYDYDLDFDIAGRGAEGEVDWDATVYNKQLERDESATGEIYVRFAKFGCNWRLVEFDF